MNTSPPDAGQAIFGREAQNSAFANIPAELRALPQWLIWKMEYRNGSLTKVPYNALTGRLAKVNDPSTWATFDQAASAKQDIPDMAGVGFVLSATDPYTCIDLDEDTPFTRNIIERFGSYTERSPSGVGFHIWIRAKLPDRGRKRPPVEVYSSLRFLTMTGDVVLAAPIQERQALLDSLVAEMGPTNDAAPVDLSAVSRPSDMSVDAALAMLQQTRHWHEIVELANGRTATMFKADGATPDWSRLDQAFVNIVQMYIKDAKLIEQIWRATPLALSRPDKMERADYVGNTVAKAFDRTLPTVPTNWTFAMNNDNVVPFTPSPGHAAFAHIPSSVLRRWQLGDAVFSASEFVIDGFLPTGITLVAGAWNTGKTTNLVPLLASAAHLTPQTWELWPVDRRKVIYVAEDPGQVRDVLLSMATTAFGAKSWDEVKEWFALYAAQRLPAATLATALAMLVKDHTTVVNGNHIPPVIVLDTVSANFALENENDNSEAAAAIAALKQALPNVPLILVGHVAKAGKNEDADRITFRGAGAWEADSVCTLYMTNVDGVRSLQLGKRRFVPDYESVIFGQSGGTATVTTSTGHTQEKKHLYGVPKKASLDAKRAQQEENKARKQEAKETYAAKQQAAYREAIMNLIQQTTDAGLPVSLSSLHDTMKGGKDKLSNELKDLIEEGKIMTVAPPSTIRQMWGLHSRTKEVYVPAPARTVLAPHGFDVDAYYKRAHQSMTEEINGHNSGIPAL